MRATQHALPHATCLIATAGAAAAPAVPAAAASPQVLRIAMTAADLPSTHGIPNNGFEGYRFLGYPPYDALVNWDLRTQRADKPAEHHARPVHRVACRRNQPAALDLHRAPGGEIP